MTEEGTGTQTATTGQPTPTPDAKGKTEVVPAGDKGTTQTTEQTTTPSGTAAASVEETFFDPKDLDAALVPAYKNMQKAFGKKMEEVKKHRNKIDAYDAFQKDPVGQLQAMAGQMGYKLTRAEAQAISDATTDDGQPATWEPKSWDEVLSRAEQRIIDKLSPVFTELQTIKKNTLERMLDDSCPDWRQYEDDMAVNLRSHPTLANDPVKLYRLSVPQEVLDTRATQTALKKLQGKVDASKVGGTSSTKTQPTSMPDKPLSFNEAVQFAKAKLAEQGIRGPG